MMKNFQILNRILTRKTEELISLLFRKPDIDELILLLRVLQTISVQNIHSQNN